MQHAFLYSNSTPQRYQTFPEIWVVPYHLPKSRSPTKGSPRQKQRWWTSRGFFRWGPGVPLVGCHGDIKWEGDISGYNMWRDIGYIYILSYYVCVNICIYIYRICINICDILCMHIICICRIQNPRYDMIHGMGCVCDMIGINHMGH